MWYDMMLLHMYVQIKVDECLIWSGMRWAFNLSRSWDTTDEQFKALVGMGMNPDCAVNLFVIIIKTANLTSELPNTVLTLLDSCKWLLENGYQSNQCVIKHQCFIMQSNTVKLLCIYDIMALYMGPQLPSMMPCYLIHVYLWCNCAVCIYSACIDTINSHTSSSQLDSTRHLPTSVLEGLLLMSSMFTTFVPWGRLVLPPIQITPTFWKYRKCLIQTSHRGV